MPPRFELIIVQILTLYLDRFLGGRSEAKEIYQIAGEGVNNRVKELWKPIETILRIENVSDDEFKQIKDIFLESMLETQAELNDLERELFDELLEMFGNSKESVFTIDEIAANLNNHEMSSRGVRTWVGRTIKQFSLFDKQAGRVNKKRAYVFSYDHVKSVFLRYNQTGGTGGQVVDGAEYQAITTNHLQNTGGTQVVDTIAELPSKKEVVTAEPLINKDNNHLTTKTTIIAVTKEKEVLDVEEIIG